MIEDLHEHAADAPAAVVGQRLAGAFNHLVAERKRAGDVVGVDQRLRPGLELGDQRDRPFLRPRAEHAASVSCCMTVYPLAIRWLPKPAGAPISI